MKRRTSFIYGMIISALPVTIAGASDTWHIATHSGMAPFGYYNEERILTGVDIDLVQLLAEQEDVQVEYIDVEFDELFDVLQRGEADFAISSITVTDERMEIVDFTDDYYHTSKRVMIEKESDITSLDSLTGKRIAALEGSDSMEYALGIDDAIVISFMKDSDIYGILHSGEADCIITDEEMAFAIAADHEDLSLLDDKIQEERYAIAVPKGNEELLLILNTGIASLRETGELEKIIEKHIIDETIDETLEIEGEKT